MIILGFSGFIGSGKNTAAKFLITEHGFQQESFAGSLKDVISSIFGWDRELLEGLTDESRTWRNEIDPWWASRLNIPNLTPRWVMQNLGTDVLRNHFHNEIWIASVENKLQKSKENVIVSDVRFPNEAESIKRLGGLVIRIKKGIEPEWYNLALQVNSSSDRDAKEKLDKFNVHSSETSLVGYSYDYTICNDGTIEELYNKLDSILLEIRK